MKNPHETAVPGEWEVWPSVDITMGDLLRAQCPPGQEPFIDIDTEAAIAVLNDRQPEDGQAGVVRLHVRAGALNLKSGAIFRQRQDPALGISRRPKKHDPESGVPYVSDVEVSIVEPDTGKLDALVSQVVEVHELNHAAKWSSPTVMRQEKRFRRRVGVNYLGPLIVAEGIMLASYPFEATLPLIGGVIVAAGSCLRMRKMVEVLRTKSPMEKSAYSTTVTSILYPRIVWHYGDETIFEQASSLLAESEEEQ